ncbi:MAG: hypothetical protein AAF740_05970, partial [Bacteroidota bacterium]
LELTEADLSFLNPEEVEVVVFMGLQDPFFKPERFEKQVEVLRGLFPNTRVVHFEGGHEVKREVLFEAVTK